MIEANIENYKTLIFDCDGVILNSNTIKTHAFYNVAKIYGHDPAQKLQDYHMKNGGVSRYEKFEYLLTNILGKKVTTEELRKLLLMFSREIREALLTCEVAENIKELRERTKAAKWLVVSGSDQIELRDIFTSRGLAKYFDGGIFGSPDDKNIILKNEKEKCNITGKSLFLGDSMYDYQAAKNAQLDFIFLNKWTEMKDWKEHFKADSFADISELLNSYL